MVNGPVGSTDLTGLVRPAGGTGVDDQLVEGPAPDGTGTDGAYGIDGTALEFTEEELTALALAADPDAPMDLDAVPLSVYLGQGTGPLPAWYMPTPMVRHGSRWRLPVVLVIVAAFVIIEAFGLCSTFGQLVPA
jgi:hypothetical protein